MYSHCTTGGWILGNTINGTQAEYVCPPHADTSLYPIPDGADEEALVMLSDTLPTGFERGVVNGKVAPGSTVAIVGAGPVGLAALLTCQFYAPTSIILVDVDNTRLEVGRHPGRGWETLRSGGNGRGRDTEIQRSGTEGRNHRGATFIGLPALQAPTLRNTTEAGSCAAPSGQDGRARSGRGRRSQATRTSRNRRLLRSRAGSGENRHPPTWPMRSQPA